MVSFNFLDSLNLPPLLKINPTLPYYHSLVPDHALPVQVFGFSGHRINSCDNLTGRQAPSPGYS